MKTYKQLPNQYQIYGLDKSGNITHAGVHGLHRVSIKPIRRLQRKWSAWREQYLRDNPGDYPLRHNRPTIAILVHPIRHPEKTQRIAI